MYSEVSLYNNKPREFIAQLYEGYGAHCTAYGAIHDILFNLIDEVNLGTMLPPNLTL